MTKRSSLYAIAVWLLCGASAYADPVTLPITSGSLLYLINSPAILDVEFPNGSARIEWDGDQVDGWVPDFAVGCCTPGVPLSLSTSESFPDPDGRFSGELLFESDIYSITRFNFSIVALRDIAVPTLEEGEGRLFTDIPFTFRGTVFGTASNQSTVVLNLMGFGKAFIALGEGSFIEPPVQYSFDAPLSPVPEPGTWILFATGLAAVMRRMRKNDRE